MDAAEGVLLDDLGFRRRLLAFVGTPVIAIAILWAHISRGDDLGFFKNVWSSFVLLVLLAGIGFVYYAIDTAIVVRTKASHRMGHAAWRWVTFLTPGVFVVCGLAIAPFAYKEYLVSHSTWGVGVLGLVGIFVFEVVVVTCIDGIFADWNVLRSGVETNHSGIDQGETFMNFGAGILNEKMICPHCGERGHVHTKQVKLKQGISGGKATAALFTAGLSMLATGLSRKQAYTQATCTNCNSEWVF